MLFNSIEFTIFLPIIFGLYWFVCRENIRAQNILLVVASYVFYGWWDWHFLGLIIFSSILDYFVGIELSKDHSHTRRKSFLILSITINLSFLFYFKYANFFIDSFAETFTFLGYNIHPDRLNIILPVGISFYTFQTLSYSIDAYKRKLKPTRDIVSFLAFVSFFPQLVAGPIERATNLLPQFYSKRKFEYHKAINGMRQILWGLFKKVVIADNCAVYVNDIFANHTDLNSSTLILGAVLFAFQIYGDFSGYSDIAIGIAKLFGFNLMQNFAFPYFSRDVAEFWRRWHISLSTWFRDYLYIPLGGSRGSIRLKIRNTFIIFLVSGFWHGANWTFLIWGLLHATYYLPLMLFDRNRNNLNFKENNTIRSHFEDLLKILFTFSITTFAWIFFRAENLNHALEYIKHIFSLTIIDKPEILPVQLIIIISIFIVFEWFNRHKEHVFSDLQNKYSTPLRWLLYYIIIFSIVFLGDEKQEFIYFQF